MDYCTRALAVLTVGTALILTGCGGGQSDQPAMAGGNPEIAAAAALSTSASAAKSTNTATPINGGAVVGQQVQLSSMVTTNLKGTYSLTGLDAIALPGSASIVAGARGQYHVRFTTSPALVVGTYQGNIQFVVCSRVRDGGCTSIARGSPILIPYTLQVVPAEWSTFQGNATHTGYVPVTIDPGAIAKAWQWTTPTGGRISPVAISVGRIAVSDDKWFDYQSTYVLNGKDGSLLWSHNFGYISALNPPGMTGGSVYVATSGHSNLTGDSQTFLFGFDAESGASLFQTGFDSQWEHYLAPTVSDGSVLTNGGAYGGIYSFAKSSGGRQWFVDGPQEDMLTPAVTSTDAFFYAYGSLFDVNRADGTVKFSITDPQFSACCYMQIQAPIVGSSGTNVITFSGDQFSGQASSSTGGYDARTLINFDLGQRAITWRTADTYITNPALSNGILYAGSLDAPRLDAISEPDGTVKWSWTPAASGTDSRMCRNIVVTNNLVFASTNAAVYAIDINTHQTVWSYPTPGDLAMDGNLLVVNVGCRESTGQMVAFTLK
jgi:outer membrane protein assembly factor BamB